MYMLFRSFLLLWFRYPGTSISLLEFIQQLMIKFIWLVLQKTDVEYIITWIMFPLLLLLLVFGRFAAIYEKKWMMVRLPTPRSV
jgi:hypothetical protein